MRLTAQGSITPNIYTEYLSTSGYVNNDFMPVNQPWAQFTYPAHPKLPPLGSSNRAHFNLDALGVAEI